MNSVELDFLNRCEKFIDRLDDKEISRKDEMLLKGNLNALLGYLYSNYEHKVQILARKYIDVLDKSGADAKGSRMMIEKISSDFRS